MFGGCALRGRNSFEPRHMALARYKSRYPLRNGASVRDDRRRPLYKMVARLRGVG